MAREAEYRGTLVGCPTCGSKVDDVELRLRDFRWVNEALPGKCGGMDIDFVLSSAKTGRALMMEMKPPGGFVSTGARLTYREFAKMGVDVWVLRGPNGEGQVQWSILGTDGKESEHATLSLEEMSSEVAKWWEEASR